MPHLQEITITKFLKTHFKLDALDHKAEFIDKQLSVCCFFSPPCPCRSSKYNQFLQSSLLSSLEEEIEQNQKNCERKSTTSFVDGRKEHFNDVISTIDNLETLEKFSSSSDKCPLIINFLMDFADAISSHKFKQWHYKHRVTAPWTPNTLLTLIH